MWSLAQTSHDKKWQSPLLSKFRYLGSTNLTSPTKEKGPDVRQVAALVETKKGQNAVRASNSLLATGNHPGISRKQRFTIFYFQKKRK